MDLRDYLRLLRIRRTVIVVCALIGLATAAALTLSATPIYKARARLFVSADDGANVSAAVQGSVFAQQRVKSYADIINSPIVMQAVIDELGVDLTAEELAGTVSASAPIDTVLLNVTATHPSPALARQIANSTAENFTKLVGQLERTNESGQPLVKVTVVQPATEPQSPVSPRRNVNLAAGLILGLGIGVAAAIARETLDTSVKGVEELQQDLGLATLGVVAYDGDASKRPLVVHESTGSPRAESFRQLRTNLSFIDVDNPPRSFVVTSSVPVEGKSTTTCNLALTISQSGQSVILVEADLRRPKVGEYLGLAAGVGLTDVLVGRVTLDDALQEWGDGTLKVLLAGPRPPNPSELLGSRHMADLIRELERRGVVIVDSPPLLPVTDAAVLSASASGALLVVRAGKTRREQVKQAVDSLRGVDARVFGAILNMAPAKGPDAYRYGYGYGYGSDGPAEAPATPRPLARTEPAPAHVPAPAAGHDPAPAYDAERTLTYDAARAPSYDAAPDEAEIPAHEPRPSYVELPGGTVRVHPVSSGEPGPSDYFGR